MTSSGFTFRLSSLCPYMLCGHIFRTQFNRRVQGFGHAQLKMCDLNTENTKITQHMPYSKISSKIYENTTYIIITLNEQNRYLSRLQQTTSTDTASNSVALLTLFSTHFLVYLRGSRKSLRCLSGNQKLHSIADICTRFITLS